VEEDSPTTKEAARVNPVSLRHCHENERADKTQQLRPRSGGHRRTCPLLGSLSSEEAERPAGDQVALEGEGVVDGGLSGEEALC
jgi:hypothetical protein